MFSKLKEWRKKRRQPVEQARVSDYQETYDQIAGTDCAYFQGIYSQKHMFLEVESFQDNIAQYVALLEMVKTCLIENHQLDKPSFNKSLKTIKLQDFYLDSDGNYLDPVLVTKSFMEISGDVIKIFEYLNDNLENISFPNIYNLRLIVKTIRQVQAIVDFLAKLSD